MKPVDHEYLFGNLKRDIIVIRHRHSIICVPFLERPKASADGRLTVCRETCTSTCCSKLSTRANLFNLLQYWPSLLDLLFDTTDRICKHLPSLSTTSARLSFGAVLVWILMTRVSKTEERKHSDIRENVDTGGIFPLPILYWNRDRGSH